MNGVFLGTFDPPHIGHINAVTGALNSKLVDNVIVIPAYKNVWKETETPFSKRLTMAKYAFRNIENVSVSDVEEKLSGGTGVPTWITLRYLNETIGKDSYYVIVSTEVYNEVHKWEKGLDIFNNTKFIVVSSSHFGTDFTVATDDVVVHVPDISICSTNLREKIKLGLDPRPFIQDDLYQIIKHYGLYK